MSTSSQPPTERRFRTLELAAHGGKVLMCRIRTDVGKHICLSLGEDAQYMHDTRQFALVPDEVTNGWLLEPNTAAKNQTVVNGKAVTSIVTLADGDVIGVGNEAKKIVKLPLTVRFGEDARGQKSEIPAFDGWRDDPSRAAIFVQQAEKFLACGQLDRARECIQQAISVDWNGSNPSNCPYYILRAAIRTAQGSSAEQQAYAKYSHAIEANHRGAYPESRHLYLEAIQLDDSFLWSANNLSWLEATCRDEAGRNGPEAVKYARVACNASQWHSWGFIDTLAAAYAECGDFTTAIMCVERAIQIAPPAEHKTLQAAVAGYRKNQPLWFQNIVRDHMELIEIPAGKFTMGSPAGEKDRNPDGSSERESQVSVTLTKPFGLGKYEVTQGDYKKVMGTQPWLNPDGSGVVGPFGVVQIGEDNPATYVSWDDATEFCEKLTEIERNAGTLKANEEYRLPTEAEWEYACRAGTTTAFSFGDDEKQLGEYAWFEDNAFHAGEPHAHKVGLKKPNPWGLYDMHGNVWEWCSDWKDKKLSGGIDPVGPGGGEDRVLRGGGWRGNPGFCRSANRSGTVPSFRTSNLGFRVARSQYQSPSAQISPSDDVKRLDNWFLTFWICMAAGIPLLIVIVGIGGVIAGVVFYCFIIHKLWSLIPVNVAKTTPGKAVGFFFIPFFNFYWSFVAFHGLAQALNAETRRHSIPNKEVNESMSLTFCILMCCSIIPFLGIPASIAGLVIWIITLKQMKDAGIALIQKQTA